MSNYTDAEILEFAGSIRGFEPYTKSSEIIDQLLLKLNDALKEIEQWRKHAEERADTHELEVRNLRAENEALRTRNDLLANRAYPPERDWGL